MFGDLFFSGFKLIFWVQVRFTKLCFMVNIISEGKKKVRFTKTSFLELEICFHELIIVTKIAVTHLKLLLKKLLLFCVENFDIHCFHTKKYFLIVWQKLLRIKRFEDQSYRKASAKLGTSKEDQSCRKASVKLSTRNKSLVRRLSIDTKQRLLVTRFLVSATANELNSR